MLLDDLVMGSTSMVSLVEEVKHEKLAAQSIYRELHEADEANLLEEEGK